MNFDQTTTKQPSELIACDPDKLADLRDIRIDTALPVRERIAGFVEQVGNPYLFKVDGLVIKATYLPHVSRRLSDAIPGLLIP